MLARADIVLSTTGAPEPIVTPERYEQGRWRARDGGPVVILDIAVPRNFDPRIHDGDRTCLFNIDDLKRIRDATLAERAEARRRRPRRSSSRRRSGSSRTGRGGASAR